MELDELAKLASDWTTKLLDRERCLPFGFEGGSVGLKLKPGLAEAAGLVLTISGDGRWRQQIIHSERLDEAIDADALISAVVGVELRRLHRDVIREETTR